jgi:hypothetical protein
MSASTPDGSLTALIQSSLRRSLLHVFRLTLPGSDLIAAQTSGPGTSRGSLPSAAPCQPSGPSPGGTPGSSPAAAIIDHIRAVTSSCRRLLTFAVSVSSDCLSADPIIRPSRILLGCSICSSRSLASSASRTRWAWRSRLQTSSASHLVSFSASATEHSRNPRNVRTVLRARSAVRPSQSNSPRSEAGTFTCEATQPTASSGSSERPAGKQPFMMKNFSHSASPSLDGPVRPVSRSSSSPTSVQCSISSSSSSTRAMTSAPPADRQCFTPRIHRNTDSA